MAFGTGAVETPSTSYDRIPYPSYSYSQTYPDHLAVLGTLTGIHPAPLERCRILELGCASGGNLIPIAYTLPGSKCLGIDFSGKAIKEARATADQLKVKNVDFLEMDFLDLKDYSTQSASIGVERFDFIIAHGIFTWVSKEVQHRILAACRQILSANGIAYISYNTYPGWYLFRIVRDFMFFHTRGSADNEERIESAKSIVDYLSEAMPQWEPLMGQIFSQVQRLLSSSSDGYIRHDFLAEVNEPLYFSEFVKLATAHDLQYLANADIRTPAYVPEDIAMTVLEGIEDDIEIEQYMDFLRSRFFRQTLLCRKELPIERALGTSHLANLSFSTQITAPTEPLDLISTEVEEFSGPGDLRCTTAHPLTKAALMHLTQSYPNSTPYIELEQEAWRMLAEAGAPKISEEEKEKEIEILKGNLVRFYNYSLDLMQFHTFVPEFVSEVSERPEASKTARYQAENKQPITNQYHQGVKMNQFHRDLLSYLDGQRTQQDLLEIAVESVRQGTLEVSIDGSSVDDPQLLREQLDPIITNNLESFAKAALLIA